jgi:hypothetical protein
MAHFGLVYLPLLELGFDNAWHTQHTAGCLFFFSIFPTVSEIMVFYFSPKPNIYNFRNNDQRYKCMT